MDGAPKFEEEDIHICGACGAQFSDVEFFISHKKHSCPVRLARQQHDQQSRNKLQPEIHDTGQTVETSIQGGLTAQSISNEIQPSYGANTAQYTIELVQKDDGVDNGDVGNDEEAMDYLQEASGQTSAQEEAVASITQFVTQSEYGHTEADGSGTNMTHEYVLLSGPSSDEQYSSQDQTFDPSVSSETVYTLDSHTLQAGLTTIPDQPITTQEGGDNYFQATITQPITAQSALMSQTGSHASLQVGNTLSVASENQSALETAMSGTVLDVNQSNIAVSVPVQDGFVTSSDQNSEIRYTISLDAEGRAQLSEMKMNDMVQSEELSDMTPEDYDPGPEDAAQDLQGLKQSDVVKSGGYDQNTGIQYTLAAVTQSSEQTEDVVRPTAGTQQQSRLEAKLKSVKTMQGKSNVAASQVKKAKPNLEKKFKCNFPECKYKTAYLKDLERHHRIHTGEKPFKCDTCGKAFTRNDKLTLHTRYHLNQRSFKCQLCDYSAVEKGSLKKHMKIHMDERPFSCQVCPYKSRSASQLQVHLRTHTGDAPYLCQLCPARFKVGSDLRRHVRTHTGERPYPCPYDGCNYHCAIKSNLRCHFRTHHKVDQELTCDECGFKTSSKKTLFEHKKSHNVIIDLTCEKCGYQCSNRSALKNHLKMHEGLDARHKCNYCKYTSVQSGNIQAHMRRKHPTKITRKAVKRSKLAEKLESKDVEVKSEEDREVRGNAKTKCLRTFKCDLCAAAFVREDSLKCHKKQHKDTSLSTAYAVLKLQQPIINSSGGSGTVTTDSAGGQSNDRITRSQSRTGVTSSNQSSGIGAGNQTTGILTSNQSNGNVAGTQSANILTSYQSSVNSTGNQLTSNIPGNQSAGILTSYQSSVSVTASNQSNSIVTSGLYLQDPNSGSSLQTVDGKDPILFSGATFPSTGQATSIQGQTVNLGINDILLAAGVSGLSSTGDSPTSKQPLRTSPFQESPPPGSIVGSSPILSPNSSPGSLVGGSVHLQQTSLVTPNSSVGDVQSVLLGQSPQDVPSVQVMQNISLPYIRLPNGQVLILTGQNSVGQLVTQLDTLAQPEMTTGSSPAHIPTQIFAQQPTTEQQQLIQSPADSTNPGIPAPQLSPTQQQPGAIPIQIILPNDSQQAIPLVTQLLNSVISRGTGENQVRAAPTGQVTSSSPTKVSGGQASGIQNLILQIPSQSGGVKDSDGSLTESQQFVLQISGPGNLT